MLTTARTWQLSRHKMTARILIIAMFILGWIGLSVGSVHIPLLTLIRIISGRGESLPDYLNTIIWNVRLPRIIMALLIGSMLASSGTVVQAVFHNPLADPYIIGISASAVAGAVLAFLLDLPVVFYGVFAFIISVATTFLIFRLAMGRGAINISTLLIIGVAASSFLGAFTSFAMYSVGEDSYRIIIWTMGFLGSANWLKIMLLIPPMAASLFFFYFHRHDLDALMLGDQEAHALGINVGSLKKKLLVISCLIVSFSVAFSGMIGFVGLIIPHTVRLLIGHSNIKLLGITALAGGVFLLFADTLARNLLAPVEIPIGTVTAFFGAPFFIYLALRSRGGVEL